jgi:DNA topoisomerase-1
LEVTLRGGRYGPYLQLGEQIKLPKPKRGEKKPEVEKPKRASIPRGVSPDDVDLEKALGLLSLPREIGLSPEDGEPIVAGIGRFGSYVKHGKTYANLEEGDDVLTIGLNRAVTLIAEKKANPKKGRRFGADPGKVLGEHPDQGGPVVVKNGRYGPYVSHNGINATITGDRTPETITLTEAVVLLDARADQLSSQPRRAAGRKKAGEPSEAPKGRKKKTAEPVDKAEKSAKPRKKPAKKAAKFTAAE